MAQAVIMPKAGITVESCIISQWQKRIGDQVKEGDILFTYETDKTVFECESTAAGELLAVFFEEGDKVPCLVNVCAIGNPGEDVSALRPEAAVPAAEGVKAAAGETEASFQTAPARARDASGSAASRGGPISPRAKKLAERAGADASQAVDTERGLMVPTVRNADQKSLLQISKEVKELAAQARDGSINPDLLKGGSFTVSNLGAVGVEFFTPVINPPQTGILGVCRTVDRVRKNEDGTVDVYPAMGLSMTYDHRAVDGAPLSRYMQTLCDVLENFPALLAE